MWESDFSIPFSKITRFHGASESFKLWSALAYTYSEVRRVLPAEERYMYDALYLPFVGPFTEQLADENHPFELHDTLKPRLMVRRLVVSRCHLNVARNYGRDFQIFVQTVLCIWRLQLGRCHPRSLGAHRSFTT
jgi:hypothetical protein